HRHPFREARRRRQRDRPPRTPRRRSARVSSRATRAPARSGRLPPPAIRRPAACRGARSRGKGRWASVVPQVGRPGRSHAPARLGGCEIVLEPSLMRCNFTQVVVAFLDRLFVIGVWRCFVAILLLVLPDLDHLFTELDPLEKAVLPPAGETTQGAPP